MMEARRRKLSGVELKYEGGIESERVSTLPNET
jgi:hypothetical protein